MTRTGRYVVIEGPDGSGKSLVAGRLVERLTALGHRVTHVREPGGTPLGEAIRRLLLDRAFEGMSRRAELMLYMAARAELAEKVIGPALKRGEVVVSDRNVLSSAVYQGMAGGIGRQAVYDAAVIAMGDLRPTLTLIVDVPVNVARARMAHKTPDRIEAEPDAFHETVRRAYLDEASRGPAIAVIDGNRSPEDVFEDVWSHVESHVKTTAGPG